MVNYEKLGEVIDGYGGISADDLAALPAVGNTRSEEIDLLRDENARLRQALAEVELILTGLRPWSVSQVGCRHPLAEVELILRGLRGGCSEDDSDLLGG